MALWFDCTLDEHHIQPHRGFPAVLNSWSTYRTFDASVLNCKRLTFCHDMLHLLRRVVYKKTITKISCGKHMTLSILNQIWFQNVMWCTSVFDNNILKILLQRVLSFIRLMVKVEYLNRRHTREYYANVAFEIRGIYYQLLLNYCLRMSFCPL